MAFTDLRDWLDHLRREGELHEVTAQVDPHLEITEITDRISKSGSGAVPAAAAASLTARPSACAGSSRAAQRLDVPARR